MFAGSAADDALLAPFHVESPAERFTALEVQLVVASSARGRFISVECDRARLGAFAVVFFFAAGGVACVGSLAELYCLS